MAKKERRKPSKKPAKPLTRKKPIAADTRKSVKKAVPVKRAIKARAVTKASKARKSSKPSRQTTKGRGAPKKAKREKKLFLRNNLPPKRKASKTPKTAKKRISQAARREFAKRSAAAKRGHRNRKRREREERRRLEVPEYEPPADLVIEPIGRTELEERADRIAFIKTLNFADVTGSDKEFAEGRTMFEYAMGYTRKDGSVAKHFSSLRWDLAAKNWKERLDAAAEEFGKDSAEFKDAVSIIASEADVRDKEVYTFFESP